MKFFWVLLLIFCAYVLLIFIITRITRFKIRRIGKLNDREHLTALLAESKAEGMRTAAIMRLAELDDIDLKTADNNSINAFVSRYALTDKAVICDIYGHDWQETDVVIGEVACQCEYRSNNNCPKSSDGTCYAPSNLDNCGGLNGCPSCYGKKSGYMTCRRCGAHSELSQ